MTGFSYGSTPGATYGDTSGATYSTALPRQVTGLFAEYNAGAVTLSWDAAGSADDYAILRSGTSGSTASDYSQIGTTSNLTFTDDPPGAPEDFFYRVVARNDRGDGPLSEERTLPAREDQPVLGNGVEDEVAVDRETQVTSRGQVRIQIRETGQSVWDASAVGFAEQTVAFDTLTTTFPGREDGEEYEVRARTEFPDEATGRFTDPVAITTQFPPVTSVTASVTQNTGSVTVSWTDNADNEDGIEVQRRELSTDSGTPTAYTVRDTLAPNTETYSETVAAGQYEYRLRAFTEDASSVSASTATVTRATQIPTDDDAWTVVASNLTDPETNVSPRIERTAYNVDPVVDTANPFGDYGVFKADDTGGDIFDLYPRGERVEFYPPGRDTPRLTGYVVERRELEQNGADVLEVEAYSFDQFLRRNTVTNDQRGNSITEALEDIVTTDTPVSFVAGNVEVEDGQQLTRSYRGEPVEDVLRDFAFKSGNEEFGVNDDLEFFFRPRETRHIDRGIDRTQWFNYDIPELGKETINEVEVWFADGDKSVVVDDGTDKLDLQDSLGLPDPGTQRAELQRPLITDVADAEDIGRKYLKFRTATLSGTVTTFDLYDAEPGDTIDVSIPPRGIDTEFVIAAVEYRWGRDETELTVVERRGDVDDILADLSDSVQRNKMEGANRDAVQNRITTTNATALVDVTVAADGNAPDATRVVNDGRRAIRDAWAGDAPPDVTTLVVGDDNSGLSRSNTTLRNQTASTSVTQSLPDATSVTFSASVTETGVAELGLEAADGTLLTRATFDSPVSLSGTVTVTLSVNNDGSVSRGVLTTDGQTGVRDVLADNSPALPDTYAYGDGQSGVSESDTALDNQLVTAPLDVVTIQSATTTTDFADLVSLDATTPLQTAGGTLELVQSGFFTEAEAQSGSAGGVFSDSGASNGEVVSFFNNGHSVSFSPTPQYTIPSGDVGIAFRYKRTSGDTVPGLNFELNNTVIIDFPTGWTNNTGFNWFTADVGGAVGDLTAGDTATVSLTVDGETGDNLLIDALFLYDQRFSYTFDNSVDADGYLSAPALFPTSATTPFTTATARQEFDDVAFNLSAPDVSGDFFVELSGDGGNSFTRVSNSRTGSVTFSSLTDSVDSRVRLGPTGETRSTATPTEQFNGQEISQWELTATISAVRADAINETLARAVVAPNTITGETIREAGVLSGSTLLTRHVLAEFNVLADQRLASSETTTFTGTE